MISFRTGKPRYGVSRAGRLVFVCKLRKKLAAATGGDNYIETVWGRGYVLRDPVQRPGDPDQNSKQAASA